MFYQVLQYGDDPTWILEQKVHLKKGVKPTALNAAKWVSSTIPEEDRVGPIFYIGSKNKAGHIVDVREFATLLDARDRIVVRETKNMKESDHVRGFVRG